MRVTLASQTANAKYYISTVFDSLVKAQEQVATGKRIQKPSDDPVGTNQSMMFTQSISDIDQFVQNISLAKDFLNASNTAVHELYQMTQEMANIASQANNSVQSEESRLALVSKLDALKQRATDLANTKHLGRYVFSGTKTDTSPLAHQHTFEGTGAFASQATAGSLTINGVAVTVQAGDTASALAARINGLSGTHQVTASESGGHIVLSMKSSAMPASMTVTASGGYTLDQILGSGAVETVSSALTYGGNSGQIQMQVGPSTMQSASMTADRVLNLDGAAAAGLPDFFQQIDDLKAAVISGDSSELAAQMNQINQQSALLLSIDVQMGSRIQNIEGTQRYLETTQDNLKELRSKTEDVDITQAVVNLKTQEQVYQASLYSASAMFRLSLMDFLG